MIGQLATSLGQLEVKLPATVSKPEPENTISTGRGLCRPFGATPRAGGVNFAVFSRHAERVHLVLFKEGQEEPIADLALDPHLNRTGDIWHIFVRGLTPDMLYGYR